MTDKQNFQAVINCAPEMPIGSFLYPKSFLANGKNVTLSDMLRLTAQHIDDNDLNNQGQLVQIVRTPSNTQTVESDADIVELPMLKKNTTAQPDQVSVDVIEFATPDKEALYREYAELIKKHLPEFLQMLNDTIVADTMTPDTTAQAQFGARWLREHSIG